MSEATLVIIARAPEPERVKTRLAAGIGTPGALHVYRQLLGIVTDVQRAWSGPVLLAASGAESAWADSGLEHLPRRAQPAGALGGRIAAALNWGLDHAERAIAIGTDCPGLRLPHLLQLLTQLDHAPVAFGPAEDGGYWGVGVSDRAPISALCAEDLPWSTPQLLAESRQCLDRAGLAYAAGDILADCDDADDLTAAVRAGLLAWPAPAEIHR